MESNLNNFKNYVTEPPPSMSSLPRQPSIYSLTFDEFQTTVGGIGKDYGSMNMDELLKSIWSAEDVQNTGSTTNNGVIGNNHSSNNTNNNQENNTYLTRQGSLTLPRTLSQKTVDEVWRDMSKEYSNGAKDKSIGFGIPNREPTLGEVTLEEFLVRAGVVREDAVTAPKITTFTDLSSTINTNSWGLGYGFQTQQGKGTFGLVDSNSMQSGNARPTMHRPEILPKPPNFAYATVLEMSSGNNQMSTVVESLALQNGGLGMIGLGANGVTIATNSPVLSSDALTKSSNNINNGDKMSSVSPVPCVFSSGLRGRKSAPLEKVIERRQRRMIKNRESAARSRARKQAYTTELEEEVARLKEENEELRKKQAQIIEMQKNQAIEMMRQQSGAKRRCLRRTQTALW